MQLPWPMNTTIVDLSGLLAQRSIRGFEGCEHITVVTLPPALKVIGARALRNCLSLKRVRIPPTVERICERAFECCRSLNNVKMPANLKVIECRAFAHNASLEHLDLRHCHKLWPILTEVFVGCAELKSAWFPLQPMGRIGTWAFKGCVRLGPVVHLPGSLLYIGSAFVGCWNLERVVANKVEIGGGANMRFGLPACSAISAPEKTARKLGGVVANETPSMLLAYYWKLPKRDAQFQFPPQAIAFLLFAFDKLRRTAGVPILPFEIITLCIFPFLNCTDLEECQYSLTRKPAGSLTTKTKPHPPTFTASVRATQTKSRLRGSIKRPAELCSPSKSKRRRATSSLAENQLSGSTRRRATLG